MATRPKFKSGPNALYWLNQAHHALRGAIMQIRRMEPTSPPSNGAFWNISGSRGNCAKRLSRRPLDATSRR